MNSLTGFDPIKFLEIKDVNPKYKHALSLSLLEQISQYIIIKTAEALPEKSTENINTPAELFALAHKETPDFDNKIKQFLQDFKDEYKRLSK